MSCKIFFSVLLFSLLAVSAAHACMGGIAPFGKARLMSGSATYNDRVVAYPQITGDMKNKRISVPLIKEKDLTVEIVYVKANKNKDVVATYYLVKQEGFKPTTVRVESNITESGMVTRSLVPVKEEGDPVPSSDQVFGCGGVQSGAEQKGTG